MFDANFFVLIPTILFIVLTYKPIKKHLGNFLDARADKIRNQLKEAENLRIEAEEILQQSQKRERRIHEEAKAIIDHAVEEVERLQKEAKVALEDTLRRREQMAFTRIATAEREAMNSVRQFAIQLTIETVHKMLKEKLPQDVKDDLFNQTLKELPEKMQLH